MAKALFPGSFDPVTLGHEEIVQRALKVFDQVIVAMGVNSQKKYFFTEAERMEMLRLTFASYDQVKVVSFQGLTIECARDHQAPVLLRGIRSYSDLEYEQPTSMANRHLAPEVETIYMHSDPQTLYISSTVVREVIRYKGKLKGMVPEAIIPLIREKKY
jgi:pantetheine-phosphate adenylyltransferase